MSRICGLEPRAVLLLLVVFDMAIDSFHAVGAVFRREVVPNAGRLQGSLDFPAGPAEHWVVRQKRQPKR